MDSKKRAYTYARKHSLNVTLQPFNSPEPRKAAISVCSYPNKIQSTCRICLQECPAMELCDCRGSSMIHIDCLKQYIAKGQGNFKSKTRCEICGSLYNLVFQKKCRFSCQSGISYIKKSVIASTLFLIFSLLTIIYITYCLYINGKGQLQQDLQLVLLIIGLCLSLVFLVILIRWIYLYMFVTVSSLTDIQPSRKGSIQITLQNLNQSQQHFK